MAPLWPRRLAFGLFLSFLYKLTESDKVRLQTLRPARCKRLKCHSAEISHTSESGRGRRSGKTNRLWTTARGGRWCVDEQTTGRLINTGRAVTRGERGTVECPSREGWRGRRREAAFGTSSSSFPRSPRSVSHSHSSDCASRRGRGGGGGGGGGPGSEPKSSSRWGWRFSCRRATPATCNREQDTWD